MTVRDPTEFLLPAVIGAINALDLEPEDEAMVKIARHLARVIDQASAAKVAYSARWIVPELVKVLAELGAARPPVPASREASRLPSSTTPSAACSRSTSKVYGHAEPRISVPAPLRVLNEETSLGPQVIAFAKAIGEPLLPHQEIAVMRMFELNPDTGRLRFRYVLIQCARQNSKTHLARIVTLWRMFMSSRPQTILGVAQDLSQSAYSWELALRTAENCPYLAPSIVLKSRASGQYRFRLASGAEYTIRSANARAGRGLTCGMVVFDELRTQVEGDGWASVT